MMFQDLYEDKVLVNREVNIRDYDYICGEDRLIYCKNCHSPKQVKIWRNGNAEIHTCLCHCETEKRDAEEAEQKRKQNLYRIQRLRDAGLRSPLARHFTFENDDGTNGKMFVARSYVEDWEEWRKQNQGLLVSGTCGSGKTFFAGCIANGLIDRGVPVMMVSTPDLLHSLTSLPSREAQDYLDSIDRYSLLILDDYEPLVKDSMLHRMLYMIVDRRYTRRKPLIVVTESSLESIRNAALTDPLNGRVNDRILDLCRPVMMTDMNRRQTQRSKNYEIAQLILSKRRS